MILEQRAEPELKGESTKKHFVQLSLRLFSVAKGGPRVMDEREKDHSA